MANPNAFVAYVDQVLDPQSTPQLPPNQPSQYYSVHFAGAKTAKLDVTDPRSAALVDILRDAWASSIEAFVDLDPATSGIARLYFPHVARVTGLDPRPTGDVEVRLRPSAGSHVLRRSNPDFDELHNLLRTARKHKNALAVTETPNEHEVIDARASPAPPPAPHAPGLLRAGDPTHSLPAVSEADAQRFFSLVEGKTCEAVSPHAPCIPFLYPDDGCHARAHEMCRLMTEAGATPAKIWNYAPDGHRLHPKTANHPDCRVIWSFHVAPILRVTTGKATKLFVIDPSLFDRPVPIRTWTGAQGNTRASHVFTDTSVYDQPPPDRDVEQDPTFATTRHDLAYYRLQLKTRSLDGPPPYSHCRV
jgi:hypothetical protein